MDRTTVSHRLSLHLFSSDGVMPLEAELRYDAADPHAITALFENGGDEPVRWVFARELLASGMDERSGDGDVMVWPTQEAEGRPAVHIRLCSPHGDALLEAPADELAAFVAVTSRLVPPGTEHRHLDLDGMIQALLAES